MVLKTRRDLEDALKGLDPASLDVVDPVELRAVAEAADAEAAQRQRVMDAVRAAREAGYSWGKIAIALGVTRQSARERFRDL